MSNQPNEILEAAAAAKAQQDAAAKSRGAVNRNHWPMRIIGVGIGSAAVAAAVLFANSGRKKG
jgi:hypothetical protein